MAILKPRSKRAPHRVKFVAHYPRNTCAPIECGVVIAEYLSGDEGYDVTSNFMGPFSLHAVMAMALNVPANRLRHKAPRDSGGSFGVKQAVFPYVVLMCLASRKAGAPVKWVEDRLEHLSAATSATARALDARSRCRKRRAHHRAFVRSSRRRRRLSCAHPNLRRSTGCTAA